MKSVILSLALFLMISVASAQIAHFSFESDPGDFIGQGLTGDIYYTPANSYFFSAQIGRSIGSDPAELLFVLGGSNPAQPFSLLFFGTDALGIPMQEGTYLNAQRADFAAPGHPGLDVSYASRGSNTLTGSFVVTDFEYDSSGVEHFLASFEQHSEGAAPALRGTFEYSSTTLLSSVPEPSAYAISASVLLLGVTAYKRLKRAVPYSGW